MVQQVLVECRPNVVLAADIRGCFFFFLVKDVAALVLPHIYCTLHFNKFQRCNRCVDEIQGSVRVSRKSKREINHTTVSRAFPFFAYVTTEPEGLVRQPPRQVLSREKPPSDKQISA